jgi:hypothetical protein
MAGMAPMAPMGGMAGGMGGGMAVGMGGGMGGAIGGGGGLSPRSTSMGYSSPQQAAAGGAISLISAAQTTRLVRRVRPVREGTAVTTHSRRSAWGCKDKDKLGGHGRVGMDVCGHGRVGIDVWAWTCVH